VKYIELLGLPGSGKTTLLRAFRDRGFAGQAGKVVLSEDWPMVIRRLGYRDVGLLRGRKKREPEVSRQKVLSNHLLDRWQMGVFDKYPELFAQIFLCFKTVVHDDRQRAILLNYWRSRMSLYLDVSHSTNPSFCVVDEGLSQTVFSTMTRMMAPSNRKLELVDSVLRCLPSERTVIMLQTPRELIEMRAQSGKGRSSEDLSRRLGELDFIFQQQNKLGVDSFELDGSLSTDELCIELEAKINRTGKG